MKNLFLKAFILFLFCCGIIILITQKKDVDTVTFDNGVIVEITYTYDNGIDVAEFLEMTKGNITGNSFGNITGVRFSDVQINSSLE